MEMPGRRLVLVEDIVRVILEALDMEWLLYLWHCGYQDIRREIIDIVYFVYMFGLVLDV
jgi:hypothetical protein